MASTLAVHALLALLLLERRQAPRAQELPEHPAGIRIQLSLLPPPPEPEPAAAPEPMPESPRPDRREPPPEAPPTAITQPVAPQQPTEEAADGSSPARRIDWHAEAARLAAQAEKEKRDQFGPPVQKMREPCKPRKSSFEWKTPIREEEQEDAPPSWQQMAPGPPGSVRGGSVQMGGTRVGVVGISIPLGGKPPPNKHLFDDMKEGKTPHSSVPDPHFCD